MCVRVLRVYALTNCYTNREAAKRSFSRIYCRYCSFILKITENFLSYFTQQTSVSDKYSDVLISNLKAYRYYLTCTGHLDSVNIYISPISYILLCIFFTFK
jgi:hypothetical protein